MAETQEQGQCLPLTGKRKNHPGKDTCQELLRSQSQEGTVSLLEPKVREEGWESIPSLWALISFSVETGLLTLYPWAVVMDRLFPSLDITVCVLRGHDSRVQFCLHHSPLFPQSQVSPSFMSPPLPPLACQQGGTVLWGGTPGGKEAPVSCLRLDQSARMWKGIPLQTRQLGLTLEKGEVILSTLWCRLGAGLGGCLWGVEGGVESPVIPQGGSCCLLQARLAGQREISFYRHCTSIPGFVSFLPTFSFSSCLSRVFSQNSYGNRVFSCPLPPPCLSDFLFYKLALNPGPGLVGSRASGTFGHPGLLPAPLGGAWPWGTFRHPFLGDSRLCTRLAAPLPSPGLLNCVLPLPGQGAISYALLGATLALPSLPGVPWNSL